MKTQIAKIVVDASLFAPKTVGSRQHFSVQVVLHTEDVAAFEEASALAKRLDSTSVDHDRTTLEATLREDDRVEARFFSENLEATEQVKNLRWRGRTTRLVFETQLRLGSKNAKGRVLFAREQRSCRRVELLGHRK